MYDYSGLGLLFAMGIFVTLIMTVICLVFYVLKSIGLYTLADKRGIENPWLAWIPVADLYIMGLLVGDMDIFGYHLDNMGLWCPVIVVGGAILGSIPVLGILIYVALLVFTILFVYRLFSLYSTEAVLYTVLSVLLCLFPVFIFIIRNNDLLAGNGPYAGPPASNP